MDDLQLGEPIAAGELQVKTGLIQQVVMGNKLVPWRTLGGAGRYQARFPGRAVKVTDADVIVAEDLTPACSQVGLPPIELGLVGSIISLDR